jgi:hypothetical protein
MVTSRARLGAVMALTQSAPGNGADLNFSAAVV